jgi:DNA helicase IV
VASVLPSLGETAVTQATITSLLSARVRVKGDEAPEVAEVKGRAVMAEVMRRLAHRRITVPKEPVAVPLGLRSLRFEPDIVAEARDTALAADLPLNEAKTVFTEVLMRDGRRQLLDRRIGPEELAQATGELRTAPAFKTLVDRAWPSLSGAQLVRSLLGSPTVRRRATGGLLSPVDADLLHRPSAKRVGDEPWTEADLVLLDEANALTAGGTRRYGHVVVDEAQDLSAMALRAAGRRAAGASMTILGDVAQATGIGARTSWDAVADGLGVDRATVRRRELTVGYRVPGPILDYANRLLPITAPGITPSSSIRGRGAHVEHVEVAPATIAAAVAGAAGDLTGDWSTVGVIAVADRFEAILAALADAGIDAGDTRRVVALDHAVSVVEPTTAKGLEFDATIVVEPSELAALPNGLRLLYVALTRSVQRLAIVRTAPMPDPL